MRFPFILMIVRRSTDPSQEEAFSFWAEWASYYPPVSRERKLLDTVRRKRWLVSIVHHDFQNVDALWSFLFDGDKAIVEGN